MSGKHDRASDLRAIADGRLLLNVRNGVTVPRSMLAMIADEIDALRAAPLTPAEAGGLVERLRGTHTCDGCGEYVGSQITDLTEEAATALASERAAHAETKRELSALEPHPRATNTVVSHETANVRDKPEGHQEPVAYRVHAPEDDYYGTGPDRLQFHPLAQHDMDNGYRQTPLYTRPSEQAVTEAMVVAATEEYFAASFKNTPSGAMRMALKAAMEAGG